MSLSISPFQWVSFNVLFYQSLPVGSIQCPFLSVPSSGFHSMSLSISPFQWISFNVLFYQSLPVGLIQCPFYQSLPVGSIQCPFLSVPSSGFHSVSLSISPFQWVSFNVLFCQSLLVGSIQCPFLSVPSSGSHSVSFSISLSPFVHSFASQTENAPVVSSQTLFSSADDVSSAELMVLLICPLSVVHPSTFELL